MALIRIKDDGENEDIDKNGTIVDSEGNLKKLTKSDTL